MPLNLNLLWRFLVSTLLGETKNGLMRSQSPMEVTIGRPRDSGDLSVFLRQATWQIVLVLIVPAD